MPIDPVPQTHAVLPLPDPNVRRFPSSVPAISMKLVGTSVGFNNLPLALFNNPRVPSLLRSSTYSQAAVRSQTHITSDFMQPNTFGYSTGNAPSFVTPIVPPVYGATVPNPMRRGGPTHPTPLAPSLDSEFLTKHLVNAVTVKENDPLPQGTVKVQ